jgi:hypothetical protein
MIGEYHMDLDSFKEMWESEGKKPEGAVKCLLIAAIETVKEENPDGKAMWSMVLPKEKNKDAEPAKLALQQFSIQVEGTDFKGGIAASYLGGTPENGYAYSYDNNIVVDAKQTKKGPKETKLFVKSGGKDMASPVQLKVNAEGYWKIFEYSSLFTGVKPIKGDF